MTLCCPFCSAVEDGRLEARNENDEDVVLVMFKCPFHFRLPKKILDSEKGEFGAQRVLDDWRLREGEAWLKSIGPILEERERKNMLRVQRSKQTQV